MVNWLEGYEHDPERGAGHAPTPGNRKVILHTTETGPGTLDAVRNSWRGPDNWGRGLPHFIAEQDRYVQLLPLDTCAYTSQNGGINANKAGCPIQIEIVHFATHPFNNLEYESLGKWIANLMKAGVKLNLAGCPQFYGQSDGIYPYLSSELSPVRKIIDQQFGGFQNFNGICGHQHLVGNSHWDPGDLDIHRVCDVARKYLDGNKPRKVGKMHTVMTTKKDSKWNVSVAGGKPGEQGVFVSDGTFVRHLSPADLDHFIMLAHFQAVKGEDPTVIIAGEMDDVWFSTHTLIPREKMGF